MHSNFWQTGMSIVEVILAIAIFVMIGAGTVVSITNGLSTTRLAREQQFATALAVEGLEGTTAMRNHNWSNLAVGTYGLSESGGSWSFIPGSDQDPSGRFTRMITVSAISRDGNGNIVTSGGTLDPNSRMVEVSVIWNVTPTRQNTVSMSQLLTNWSQSLGQAGGGSGGGGGTPITTCQQYCQSNSYSAGTCRPNAQQCLNNGQVYQAAGNTYCTGGASSDTCCCTP